VAGNNSVSREQGDEASSLLDLADRKIENKEA
jgi:hypothetical protein